MRRPVLSFALLLLLPSPQTAAGSEEHPELEDPQGDQFLPEGQSKTFDILAGWLRNETKDWIFATLKLSQVSSAVLGPSQDFYWRGRRNTTEDLGWWGVRARPMDGALAFFLLGKEGSGASSADEMEELVRIEGSTVDGEPGFVSWRMPRSDIDILDGDKLRWFRARSWQALVQTNGLENADEAGPSPVTYQVGSRFNGFAVPTRDPDYADSKGTTEPMQADLEAAWIDWNAPTLNISLKVRGLDLSALSPCSSLTLTSSVASESGGNTFSFRLSLVPRGFGEFAAYEDEEVSPNGTFHAQEGAPGYFQFQLASPSVSRPADAGPFAFRAESECITADGAVSDELSDGSEPPRGSGGVQVATVLLTSALGLALARCRRMRDY